MESQTKETDNHKITVNPFRGSTSNRMMVRLQQCLQGEQIICDAETWQKFCLEFFEKTFVDGKEVGREDNFDAVFVGNLRLLFLAIEYTAEVNFGKDFFTQRGGSGSTKAGQAKTAER